MKPYLKKVADEKLKLEFVRVDATVGEAAADGEGGALKALFAEAWGKNADKVELKRFEEHIPALFAVSEQSRRIADVMRQYRALDDSMPHAPGYDETLAVNLNSPLIQRLENDELERESALKLAKFICSLAALNARQLSAAELSEFTRLSAELLAWG